MGITAQAVKELRQRTGAGMMDCKKALIEVDGDVDEAVKVLRTKGLAAAAKRAHRAASEGAVVVDGDASTMALVELNCETDFVARNTDFQDLARALGRQVLEARGGDVEAIKAQPFVSDPKTTVEQALTQVIATIGENIVFRRAACVDAEQGNKLSSYLHMGGKIGVVVEGSGSISDEALHDVAMHVAAAEPRYVNRAQVTEEILEGEREIALKQATDQGKPEHIAERIVTGKMEKYFEQMVLLEQPFAKDTDKTVGQYLRDAAGEEATVTRFVRFKLGEAE